MSRPRRGLPFEDALRRWSSPEDHAELEALCRPGFEAPIALAGAPRHAREEAYSRLKRKLERAFFDRLADGEFLSSAMEEKPNPRNPRFLVHPSVYDDPEISYSRFYRAVLGPRTALWNVEVYEPKAVPRNVSTTPVWLNDFLSDRRTELAPPESPPPAEAPSAEGFRHDQGYAHVSIRGVEFTLNSVQAGIVRVLHQADIAGRPWVSGEVLRQEVGFSHAKVSGVFRHMRTPSWRELVVSDGRGAYRLNT